jgi:ABC-2 type transport system ATP-binding protein
VTVDLTGANGRAEAALEVLRVVDGATELAADGDQLRARVPNGAEAIPVILAALDEQGFAVGSVSTSRPSLDDVYLHYTGRDFSTEDAEGNA